MQNNKRRRKPNKRRVIQRKHPEHPSIDAETFEEWRTGFMKDQTQTNEGEPPIRMALRPSE
jgi:hypothetical protein